MLRFAAAFLMILFALSHGGLAGAATHEHGDVHAHSHAQAHQDRMSHDHDTGSEETDQGDTLAMHVHLLADRAPTGHIMTEPVSTDRSTLIPALQRALSSMAVAPPLEPPERA